MGEKPKIRYSKVRGKQLYVVMGQDEIKLFDGTKIKLDPSEPPKTPTAEQEKHNA